MELSIEVIDARALHALLEPTVPIEWGPEVYSYGRREFAIRDPDRYVIIFTEPTDEPPTTSEPGDEWTSHLAPGTRHQALCTSAFITLSTEPCFP